jgi:hypothetical protein
MHIAAPKLNILVAKVKDSMVVLWQYSLRLAVTEASRRRYGMKVRETVLACALAAAVAITPLAGCAAQGGSAVGSANATGSESAAKTGQDVAGDEQYVLYLGTNDKDTNQPVYPPEESKERVKAILKKELGGYTIQEAEGGWKGDDGKEYQQYTLVIYLSDTNLDTVHKVARQMIDEFHQSAVLINTERVRTEFYEGK